MEVNIVTLEDNQDYIVFDLIDYNNNSYLILSNKDISTIIITSFPFYSFIP